MTLNIVGHPTLVSNIKYKHQARQQLLLNKEIPFNMLFKELGSLWDHNHFLNINIKKNSEH